MSERTYLDARPTQALGAPGPRRKATTMDHVRTRELLRRLEAGEHEVDAFWTVASDTGIGFSEFRGAAVRPAEVILRRKLASLLARTSPHLVAAARDLALAKLSALSDDAVRSVQEVTSGEFTDSGIARARLDAAKTVLGSLGIREQGGVNVTTQTAVQVNAGVQRPSDEIYEMLAELHKDPEAREALYLLAHRQAGVWSAKHAKKRPELPGG